MEEREGNIVKTKKSDFPAEELLKNLFPKEEEEEGAVATTLYSLL